MSQPAMKDEDRIKQFQRGRQEGCFGFTTFTVLGGLSWFNLNPDAQLLTTLIYQVNNGGFTQWISNGFSGDINRIVKYLEKIGSPTCETVAHLLDQLALWDSSALGYELNATTGYFLEELDPFDHQRLKAFKDLSKEFWQISDQLCAELDTYFGQLPEAHKLVVMDPPLSYSEFLEAWDTPPTPTWIRLMEQVQQKWDFEAEALFWERGRGHLLKEFLPKLEPIHQCAFLFGDLLFQSLMNQGGAEQWLDAGGRLVLSEFDALIQWVVTISDQGMADCIAQMGEVVREYRRFLGISHVLVRCGGDIYQSYQQQKQQAVAHLNQLLQNEAFTAQFRFEVEALLGKGRF